MRLSKSLATFSAGLLLAVAGSLAVAGPAAAFDAGPELDGDIFFLAKAGGFDANTAADVNTSGDATARPFLSATANAQCPAATTNIQAWARIPQAGVPEDEWEQVQFGAGVVTQDSEGRFYTARGDLMSKAVVVAYAASQPGSTGTVPFLLICQGSGAGEYFGYFKTDLTVTAAAGATGADVHWSIPSAAYPSGGSSAVTTTTTLTASASGADLLLTAAVSPAAAAGTVTFKDGAAELGSAPVASGTASYTVDAPTQGAHHYVATFAPTDSAAYGGSEGVVDTTVALDPGTGLITLDVPAGPVVDGTLTMTVPFDTPVALSGSRTGDNSRVTANGGFPTVTVTDSRRDGLLTGWEVNAQASEFTGTAGTVGAKYLGWTPATPTLTPDVTGGPLNAQAGPVAMSNLDAGTGLAVSSLLGKSTTSGRGTAVLGAQLNLAIPGTTPAGSYTSTVTVTLVSN